MIMSILAELDRAFAAEQHYHELMSGGLRPSHHLARRIFTDIYMIDAAPSQSRLAPDVFSIQTPYP